MSGQFYLTGKIEPSQTGRSFKVYLLGDNDKWFFVGLVTLNALLALTQKRIPQADICKFIENSEMVQEPLNFSLELKP